MPGSRPGMTSFQGGTTASILLTDLGQLGYVRAGPQGWAGGVSGFQRVFNMGRASRFAAVATAAFVLAIAGQRAEAADPCAQAGLQVMPSPFSPWKGAP